MLAASDYPTGGAFLTILEFFLWVLWFMLLFRVVTDIFRDDQLGGWGKAGWMILVCVLPFLGIFIYLIVRGHSMGSREIQAAQRREEQFRAYVQEAAAEPQSAGSGADELTKLASLRDHGDISEEEFQKAKAKVLA